MGIQWINILIVVSHMNFEPAIGRHTAKLGYHFDKNCQWFFFL